MGEIMAQKAIEEMAAHTSFLDRDYDIFHHSVEVQPCKDEYLSMFCQQLMCY